ncbi:hypothetical protein [Tellurirhabdus rosea]|uniref:hypothetical protein n=1 Tax=Tellurirhabdus rosea TaxID=2674997 RepID=UPI0022549CD8|nr:hypothetical protein [Tellurirhabdus rosea]
MSFFQKKIVEDKIQLAPLLDDKLDQWKRKSRLWYYAVAAINEAITNGNIFTRFEWDIKNKWPQLSASDCFVTRIGKPKDGKTISEYHVNAGFGGRGFDEKTTEKVPVFDEETLETDVVQMFHSKIPLSGNPYYSYPSWWGSDDWIEVANLIPLFHKSGLKNGYNIKYLIRMPQDYFSPKGTKDLSETEKNKKFSDFSDNLSKWLAGVDNVNKSMLIRYMRGQDGKAQDSVDVVPLKNEMSDDAYSKVWEMSSISIGNAVGILPVLAGVTPGSKSGDSGSQIRVVADYQQHFRTPIIRKMVLEPVEHALSLMGYTNVVPAFKEVLITTLDANPTGSQAVVNHNA